MSDKNHVHTHTSETRVERRGSGATGVLAFIVGGLVVAVGVLGFVFWSGGTPEGSGAGGNAADPAAESADAPAGDAAGSGGASGEPETGGVAPEQ